MVDLYHVLIYMFLHPGEVDGAGFAFEGQGTVQNVLLLAALVAVPWMLLPKPLILKARHEAAQKAHEDEEGQDGAYRALGGGAEEDGGGGDHGGGHGEHGEFEFGEVREPGGGRTAGADVLMRWCWCWCS